MTEPAVDELAEIIRAGAKAAWDDYFYDTAVDPFDDADEEDQAEWIKMATVPVTAAYERLRELRGET